MAATVAALSGGSSRAESVRSGSGASLGTLVLTARAARRAPDGTREARAATASERRYMALRLVRQRSRGM